MPRLEVHKFDSAVLDGAQALQVAADLVTRAARNSRILVVVSPLVGTAQHLRQAGAVAAAGDRDAVAQVAREVQMRHAGILGELAVPDGSQFSAYLSKAIEGLTALLNSCAIVGTMSPTARNSMLALGAKLAARLLVLALDKRGCRALPVDADGLLETDGAADEAHLLDAATNFKADALLRGLLESGQTPVVTGCCGRSPSGTTAWLGSDGANYTAVFLASLLGADEVTLWSDVKGFSTADPRHVESAAIVRHVGRPEAAALASYGARGLEWRTLSPSVTTDIPIRVRSFQHRRHPGTVVHRLPVPTETAVQSLAALPGRHALLSVFPTRSGDVAPFMSRALDALTARSLRVVMVNHAGLGCSFSLMVPSEQVEEAERALRKEFHGVGSLDHSLDITITMDVGLITLLGQHMWAKPSIISRALAVFGDLGAEVLALALSPSTPSVSFAAKGVDVPLALQRLHEEFGLGAVSERRRAPGVAG